MKADDLINEFGSTKLSHAYDPVKAHEYYMRTRKLKPRKPGKGQTLSGRNRGGSITESSGRNRGGGSAKKARSIKSTKTAVRQKQLEARLDRLKAVLAQLVKEAQARSGVESAKSKSTAKDKAESKKSEKTKPKTTAEKKEAAKKAKEYREKNEPSDSSAKNVEAQIRAVREKIKKMRAEIAAARAKSGNQRNLNSSNTGKNIQNKTATKGR